MTLAEYIGSLKEILPNRCDALEFAASVFDIAYENVPLHLSDAVEVTEEINFKTERLRSREPLAYVINNKSFYGLDIFVDERVLIPRPETEILAEEAIRLSSDKKSMLDICTGSGCIPCAVLDSCPNICADVLDISLDALAVAEKNLDRYAQGRFGLIHSDALNFKTDKKYDLITCNPPYLDETEWVDSDISLKYEPKNALSAGCDALLFYKKLIDMVPDLCNKNGVVLFELGVGQSDLLVSFFPDKKFRFIKDYQGIERVLVWTNSL